MIQPFGNITFFDSQTKVPDNFRMYPVICESRIKLTPFQIIVDYDAGYINNFEWVRYNESNILLGGGGLSTENIDTKNKKLTYYIYDGTTVGTTLPLGFGQFYLKDSNDNEFYSQYILIQ